MRKRKPAYVGTEAQAARRARAEGRTLLHVATRDSGNGVFRHALTLGFHPKDLWVVKFPDGSWTTFEAVGRPEERRRLAGGSPARRGGGALATPSPAREPRPPRARWMGLSACTLIRHLAGTGLDVVECMRLLPRLGLHGIDPATFKIQHRQGRRGIGLPPLRPDQVKALNIARKGQQGDSA